MAQRVEKLDAEVQRLTAENANLRQLVIEYGRHCEGCSAACGDQYRCRCGWQEEGEPIVAAARPAGPEGE